MRPIWDTVAVAAIILVVLIAWPRSPGQQRPDYELRTEGRLLVFDQPGWRTIFVKPESISGFASWNNHPEFEDVVFLQLGAHEYRLDCSTSERADDIEAFLTKHIRGPTDGGS